MDGNRGKKYPIITLFSHIGYIQHGHMSCVFYENCSSICQASTHTLDAWQWRKNVVVTIKFSALIHATKHLFHTLRDFKLSVPNTISNHELRNQHQLLNCFLLRWISHTSPLSTLFLHLNALYYYQQRKLLCWVQPLTRESGSLRDRRELARLSLLWHIDSVCRGVKGAVVEEELVIWALKCELRLPICPSCHRFHDPGGTNWVDTARGPWAKRRCSL